MSSSKKPAAAGSGQRSIASFFGGGKRSSPRLKASPGRQKGRVSPARALDLKAGTDPLPAPATAVTTGCLQPTPVASPPAADAPQPGPRAAKRAAPAVCDGQRLRVFWPAEKAWFEGRVRRLQERQGRRRAFVAYDDGDEEWVDLERDRVEVLEQPGRKRARARAAQVLDSGSESDPESAPSASQGSEFLASEAEEISDDDSASMAASESEEAGSEDDSDAKPARKPAGRKSGGAAARPSPPAAAGGKGRTAASQATPAPASQCRGGLPPLTPASGLRPCGRNLAEALETPSFATPATAGPSATVGSAERGDVDCRGESVCRVNVL